MTETDLPGPLSPEPPAPVFRTGALSHRRPTRVVWQAGPQARDAMARALGLIGIGTLRIEGEITPEGGADFRLEMRLLAEVVQACGVTLAPVPARIDERVERRYLAAWAEPSGDEVELDDDTSEPLPERIDTAEVTAEALALALPPWPRAPGANLGEAVFAPPGVAPLRDGDLNPFAALAGLVRKDEAGS